MLLIESGSQTFGFNSPIKFKKYSSRAFFHFASKYISQKIRFCKSKLSNFLIFSSSTQNDKVLGFKRSCVGTKILFLNSQRITRKLQILVTGCFNHRNIISFDSPTKSENPIKNMTKIYLKKT